MWVCAFLALRYDPYIPSGAPVKSSVIMREGKQTEGRTERGEGKRERERGGERERIHGPEKLG